MFDQSFSWPRPWSYRLHKKMTPATRKRVKKAKAVVKKYKDSSGKKRVCQTQQNWEVLDSKDRLNYPTVVVTQVRKPFATEALPDLPGYVWACSLQAPHGLDGSMATPVGRVAVLLSGIRIQKGMEQGPYFGRLKTDMKGFCNLPEPLSAHILLEPFVSMSRANQSRNPHD